MQPNPWIYKIKDLNGEKIIGSFYEKGMLLSNLNMSYYPGQDSQIRDKVEVVLDLSKKLDYATGFGTSNLVAKNFFITLKVQVEKLDINKLVNVPTSMNNLKTKADDLDVGKLKTVPSDLKKLRDLVDNEVTKNTKFTTLKTKVNILGKKILDATTLIHINQCNTYKQHLKKTEDVNRKIPVTSALVTSTIFNIKFTEVENKIPNTSSLVPTTVLN